MASAKRQQNTEGNGPGGLQRKQIAALNLQFKDASTEAASSEAGSGSGGPGRVRFYFAAYNNWDDERPIPDCIAPGAFDDVLPALIKSGFSSWDHNWRDGLLPVGTVEDAGSDEYGAWAEVEFHSTQPARDVYTVAKERVGRGKDVVASMTYVVDQAELVPVLDEGLKSRGITRGRLIKHISLLPEVGLVTIPANPKAVATEVKHNMTEMTDAQGNPVEIKGLFEAEMAERTQSIYNLFDVLQCVLYRIDVMDEAAEDLGVEFDYPSALQEALSEFSARVVAAKAAEDAEEDGMDMGDMAAKGQGQRKHKRLSDGRGFKAYLASMSDVLDGMFSRTQARAEMLTKAGRKFSAENAAKLKEHADAMDEHGDAMREHGAATKERAQSMREMVGADDCEKDDDGGDMEESSAQYLLQALKVDMWLDEILNPVKP